MKEYRVVATVDTVHNYNGKKYHHDAQSCWWGGSVHRLQTYDRDTAEHWLEIAKKECPKHDKKTQEDTRRDSIHYWQSNIRIETREVTEWK